MKTFLLIVLKIYKKLLSPIVSKVLCCRFYPTCSEYAIMALQKYPTKQAVKKIINRLSRCNPNNTESCIDYP